MNLNCIKKDMSLKDFTTMGVGGKAKFFAEVESLNSLLECLDFAKKSQVDVYVIGEGSNVIFSDNGFDGLALRLLNKGIQIIKEDAEKVVVSVSAGENWDEFVGFCVQHGWWGTENMSYIPGSIGAFPVQNVGAYGQQASDIILYVDAFDRETGSLVRLNGKECMFRYRKSIFNTERKGRYIIWEVTFELNKIGTPNLTYRQVHDQLKRQRTYFRGSFGMAFYKLAKRALPVLLNSPPYKIEDIRVAIIALRCNGRLPDPKITGNCGSFFKMPIVTQEEFSLIQQKVFDSFGEKVKSHLERYASRYADDEGIFIPGSILIDACGLKGKSCGGAVVYEKNVIMIVNRNGSATSSDIIDLCMLVQETVFNKCGVKLEPEPNFIGF